MNHIAAPSGKWLLIPMRNLLELGREESRQLADNLCGPFRLPDRDFSSIRRAALGDGYSDLLNDIDARLRCLGCPRYDGRCLRPPPRSCATALSTHGL